MFSYYKAHIIQNCTQIEIYFKNYKKIRQDKKRISKI